MMKKIIMLLVMLTLCVGIVSAESSQCRNRCRYVCPAPVQEVVYVSSGSSSGGISTDRFWMNLAGLGEYRQWENYDNYTGYIDARHDKRYVSYGLWEDQQREIMSLKSRIAKLERGD